MGREEPAPVIVRPILAVLENRFADMVDQWGGLVEKSRKWLKEQVAAQDLKVGRKNLMDWARDQASKH